MLILECISLTVTFFRKKKGKCNKKVKGKRTRNQEEKVTVSSRRSNVSYRHTNYVKAAEKTKVDNGATLYNITQMNGV